jgi:hypothetical protein
MAYATAEDVAVRWAHELTCEEAALVNTRLEDVERMIRRRIPDLDDLVASGDILVDDVVQVESDAVLRLARNPEGYYSETDGNYTYMLQKDIASGKLDITDDEWATLGVFKDRFFTLRPYAQVDSGTYAPPTVPRSLWRRDIEEIRKNYRVIDWTRQIW